MKRFNHWFVCLDLTRMDDILIGYVNFLTSVIEPKTISFVHVVQSSDVADEMIELFPELKDQDDLEEAIRNDLKGRISKYFSNSEIETRLILKEGQPSDEIIDMMKSMEPDLTVMGKKAGYRGKGVFSRRISRYVPSSILFVPENSRYQIKNALVPVDFSETSSKAVTLAQELVKPADGSVTAQNIYNYPARFFPYLPEDDDEEKMEKYLNDKKESFIKEYSISADVEFKFSLHIEGTKMDEIYNQIVTDQTDLIVASSKSDKKITSILREDFTDKMIAYRFGVPLLIQKNKEKHQKFLQSLFNK